MIPYGHQNISQGDAMEVIKTLRSGRLTQGPKVAEFEKALAGYCGAKYSVAVSSGTAALHLAYLAVGLKQGDEVITTPNTFVATSNMLLILKTKPVFCDIRLDTYNLDESKIKKLVNHKTKAIVPVHFAGQPCAMAEIHRFARRRGLVVIEDACHALGAEYRTSKIGGCRYSDMAIFSFHPVKSIATGEGGAILTNSKKHYEKLISLRSHGIHKNKAGKNVMTELGFNYRLTDLQAALGVSQLKRLDSFIKARRRIVRWYERELKQCADIILPQEVAGNFSAWHIYVIRTGQSRDRDKLAAYLKHNGVGVNFHYPAVYSQPYYRQHGYSRVKLNNEEKYYNSCLTLPCFPDLTEEKVVYVCGRIKKFFK